MTIDTSKEAVERLSRMCGAEASYKTHIGTLMAQASDMLVNLAAERDAQTARADAAEAREQALLSTYDAERKALVENAALRAELKTAHAALDEGERAHGISTNGNMWRFWANEARELSAEITRLKDEIAKQMLADEMLRGLYDDEAADVARLNAELRSLRAGQDALVAAAYEAAGQEAEDHGEPGMYQAMSQQFRAGYADAGGHIASAIRALTPAAATAALAVLLRAERNKALRDAADRTLCLATGHECRAAILAMIETEANNDR